ncbi:TPR repeat-containing protein YpiA [Paraliobacillus quinghaiensis]|uniref:TPR repeat-containing protein YpiA n=1 Tax=Paraliobacillus quinghaiensis TaxID=470815 RepID=A0A917WRE1_9BACI|nr:tetratricopeptide repeat protein [Paraliobacillus quinghaiensis]GGM22898.1 TPR repeat-containing protein YpiA [Paraliobacillus quinghaiensis]
MEEIHRAIKLMEQYKTDEAISTLENYLPQANEDEKYTIAELYQQWGMLEDAKMILLGLTQQYPNETDLKLMLADIHIDLQEDQEAIELLNRFGPQDEEYLEVLLQLADLYQTQGLFEVAEQKLLEAKQIDPSEVLIDFALGELSFSNGEYQKAIPYYEKVHMNQQIFAEVDISIRLAESYAATGEFEKSLEYFHVVETDDVDVLFRYGFIGYRANRLDIAKQAWEQVIDLDPEFQSVYLYLAEVYETEGMLKEAYQIAQKGIEIDRFNKDLYLVAGSLARKVGEAQASYQYAREAVSIDPGFKEAVLFLVENYKQDEDFEAIIDLLHHIIEQGEEDGYYKWELAKALKEEESYSDALKFYQDAYNTFREDTDFLKEYGYFLVEEGRRKEAIALFEHYLTIEPSDTELEEYTLRLKDQANDF